MSLSVVCCTPLIEKLWNLLRRRTKEAYRLQKLLLHNGRPVNLDLALIYSSKEELSYKTISNAVRRILETVAEHL